MDDIKIGLWKPLSFGLIVSWICCGGGFCTRYGTEVTRKATTEAVVMSPVDSRVRSLPNVGVVGGTRFRSSTCIIAGVEAGWVERIRLKNYQVGVDLRMDDAIPLRQDSIASICTEGMIREQFVRIALGGAETNMPAGGEITETDLPMEIMALIANCAFGKV